MKLFSNDCEGYFVSRPNRFIVMAESPEGVIRAHCPNPGRLQEILLPGQKLIFEKNANKNRKTAYTLVAAYYRENVIPLYASKANEITKKLVLPLLYPEADTIKAEQKWKNSRFDFLITEGKQKIFLEVKACTLVEEGRGMFPDAPTERGKRHIKALEELAKNAPGYRGHILFVITHPDVIVFSPNIHTDPVFARILLDISSAVRIDAVSVSCTPEGEITIEKNTVPVDLLPVSYVKEDRGAYLLLITIQHAEQVITVGKLGEIHFKKGYYIYTGSAKKNLSKRISRHISKKKKFHWHIDYLTVKADSIMPFPVYTGKNIECSMAQDLEKIADESIRGFGSSDCTCSSHLFYFSTSPMINRSFQRILHHYRHNP